MKMIIAYTYERQTKNHIVYKEVGGVNRLYVHKALFPDGNFPNELEATVIELNAKPQAVAAQ